MTEPSRDTNPNPDVDKKTAKGKGQGQGRVCAPSRTQPAPFDPHYRANVEPPPVKPVGKKKP